MPCRTLLAHFADENDLEDALPVAMALAESHRSHLIGLHSIPLIEMPLCYGGPVAIFEDVRAHQEALAMSVGERVFIAWNGDRAATRALFGALPILRRAQSVRLQRMNVSERDGRRAFGTTEALAEALARHEVRVEVFHADARNAEIGRDLLGFAGDWGADLLISGCQETGAVREMVFGSTTRHLLEHAQMPLLMSS